MIMHKVFAQASLDVKQPDTIKITDIGKLISALVGTVLIIASLLAFLYLILGGIKWITSGGDKAGMEEARTLHNANPDWAHHCGRRLGNHDARPKLPGRANYRRLHKFPEAVLISSLSYAIIHVYGKLCC